MPGNLLTNFLTRLFGSRNRRTLKELGKVVDEINSLEKGFEKLSDDELRSCTRKFQARLREGEALQRLIPEAFATVREASKRALGMRPFDVQLLGGMVLTRRAVAEMRTGEGKTLTSTLPGYLYALAGKGVHVVTVNEYLAQRDCKQNTVLFEALGLKTGVILNRMEPHEKQRAYAADITYGTGSEFCFDYLRDNMVYRAENRVQRGLYYALLDEVDSILIDEARTPLIISGPADAGEEYYLAITPFIPQLRPQEKPETEDEPGEGDYHVDGKLKQVHLTERGLEKAEVWLKNQGFISENGSLYDREHLTLLHAFQACLKAYALFKKDIEYIVRDGEILIIDENTGRVMHGRRWSDGLHQAIEAKEGVELQPESQTLASISYQNYFRLYETLAGMTGTADTEALEFSQIYEMDTVVVPTNRPMIRKDLEDRLAGDHASKLKAIVEDVVRSLEHQRPVLVGTASIEKSEELSELLWSQGIQHEVLNARYHEKEAEIIAQAGRPGRVTLATNMAGRGTDIILGGSLHAELEAEPEASEARKEEIFQNWRQRHEAVVAAGGLHVIGTERHDSRRVDHQLRGRSGRQGDPGSSCFYASLDDNLLRNFLPDYARRAFKSYCDQEGLLIHPLVSSRIEQAQRLTESRDFDVRKQLLEYDDVASEHRKVLYVCRNMILETQDLMPLLKASREKVLRKQVERFLASHKNPSWKLPEQMRELSALLLMKFQLKLPLQLWLDEDPKMKASVMAERIFTVGVHELELRLSGLPPEAVQSLVRQIYLRVLDQLWQNHLNAMDKLRQHIHLRGYAQKDPKQEYKREAFQMFEELLENIEQETVEQVAQLGSQPFSTERLGPNLFSLGSSPLSDEAFPMVEIDEGAPSLEEASEAQEEVLTRNSLCPCGSGKRYKYCHGNLDSINDA